MGWRQRRLGPGQLVLPLPGGWPPSRPEDRPPDDEPRFHPRSLPPRELDEGGCFDYKATPSVFLGRTGFGPLRVAWDTKVLIDCREFGAILLAGGGGALPAGLDPEYEEQLLALGTLMTTIYMTRDVRIHALVRQLRDLGGTRGASASARGASPAARRSRVRSSREKFATWLMAVCMCRQEEVAEQTGMSLPTVGVGVLVRSDPEGVAYNYCYIEGEGETLPTIVRHEIEHEIGRFDVRQRRVVAITPGSNES